jgi:phage baseplate assembly protein gpV
MDGFPKLVAVLESARDGKTAYFEDGMVAFYDHTAGIWRPAGAHVSYEALFTTTTKTYPSAVVVRATDRIFLELAPEVAVDD